MLKKITLALTLPLGFVPLLAVSMTLLLINHFVSFDPFKSGDTA
jgi:hypothetical protein